ncbi:MAG: hypothetical protein M3Y59_17220 [Myxococcota bacterium]|nr:hypothetical protein [Myxococcota bacterium]
MANRYEVKRDGELVLTFSDKPGVLVSTAMPAPGQSPLKHPFLNARALDARFEGELGVLARGATSVDGFIAALEKAGYQVTAG